MPKFKITIRPVAEDGSAGPTIMEGEVGAYHWTTDEFDGEDLLPACRRYVEFLQDLVDRCEREFPSTAV